MIKRVNLVCFSPTGATRKVAESVAAAAAETLKLGEVNFLDWTKSDVRSKAYMFDDEDLVILASCTYAGRIPNKMLDSLKENIKSSGAVGIALMTYGNRSVDNALTECAILLKENAFHLAGAGSFVTRHSMSSVLGKGRPGEKDFEEAKTFGRLAAEKILNGKAYEEMTSFPGDRVVGPYYRPLEEDGKPANFLKAKPKLKEELCDRCGTCAVVCPMDSISKEDVSIVEGVCIKCHACIRSCPKKARYFDHESLLSHIRMLEENYAGREKANEYFL